MPEVKEVKEPKAKPSTDSGSEQRAALIHAGRPTAVCRCGEKLVRPNTVANSTWRCLRVWNGNPTEECQNGIPTELVLDSNQVAELLARKKDRYSDAKDIG